MKLIIPGYLALALGMIACSSDDEPQAKPPTTPTIIDRIEDFNFSSDGISWQGQIFIPVEYETNSDLPTIYLIDHCEQVDCVDEFDALLTAVRSITGFNPLIIKLKDLIDNQDITFPDYPKYRDLFNDMTTYVDANYANNHSRTLVGRGLSGNVVMRNLLEDETPVFQNFIASDVPSINYLMNLIKGKDFPLELDDKKLHYSFTSSTNQDGNVNFVNALNEKGFTWLDFESVEYPDLIYPNAPPSVFTDGLKFIFED